MKSYSVKTGLIETFKVIDGDSVTINVYQNADGTYDVNITGAILESDGNIYDGELEFLRAQDRNFHLTQIPEG